MTDAFFRKSSSRSQWSILVLLGVAVCCIISDLWINATTLTPLIGTILMAITVMTMRPFVAALLIIVFVGSSMAMTAMHYSTRAQFENPELTMWLRLAGQMTAGVMFFVISVERERLDKQRQSVESLLAALPMPVVITDLLGNVLQVNNAAFRMIGLGEKEVVGMSCFSLFSSPKEKGRSVERFLRIVESQPPEAVDIDVQIVTRPAWIGKATIVPVVIGKHRVVIMLFREAKVT